MRELQSFGAPGSNDSQSDECDFNGVVAPLQLRSPLGTLSFISTTTVFGMPVDITLAELAIACFYPADGATQEALSNDTLNESVRCCHAGAARFQGG